MSEPIKTTHCVVENTRRVSVELAEGVSPERFVELLNKRHVRIHGDQLVDGYSAEVLGRRMIASNTSDYKLSADQCPLPEFDTIDPYAFNYNQI